MQSTKQRLLVAVARYAKGKKGKVTSREFCRAAKVCHGTIRTHFGGFTQLLRAAKLDGREHKRVRIPEPELLAEFHRLAMRFKRYPTFADIERHGRFKSSVFLKRIGPRRRIHARYEEWRKSHAPGRLSQRDLAPRPKASPSAINDFQVGAPMAFRGLLHAPTTEAGVIHLFGLLGPDLGYAVASIRSAYPDCLAYKPAPRDPSRWSKVRIEFELRSSNFRLHGHDPKGCDLIVCWEDDWKDCPVKVVELRAELRRVQGGRMSA